MTDAPNSLPQPEDTRTDVREPKPKPTTPGFSVNPGSCEATNLRTYFDDFKSNPAFVRDTGGLTPEDEAVYEEAMTAAEKIAPLFADDEGRVRVIVEGMAGNSVNIYVAPGD